MSGEILMVIARVRRAMPRNGDVMLICSELEQRLIKITPEGVQPKFDRVGYMRGYMRDYRKRRKAEGTLP
mgnify:CR=1 FL=1